MNVTHPGPLIFVWLLVAIFLMVFVTGIVVIIRSPGARWPLLALGVFLLGGLVLAGSMFVSVERRVVHENAREMEMKQRKFEEARRADEMRKRDGTLRAAPPVTGRRERLSMAERPPVEALAPSPPPEHAESTDFTDFTDFSDPNRVIAHDDLAAWKREGDALGFQGTSEAPGWLADAAGSRLVEDRAGDTYFRIWKPGPGDRLVGYSGPEPTAEDAIDGAREEAAAKLGLLAVRELEKHESTHDPVIVFPLARSLALARIGQLHREDHLQRAELTPGVPVWRAAVLVESGPEEMAELSAGLSGELARGWAQEQLERRRLVGEIFGAAFLCFVIFLVYTLVNARTKGHFAWPLRLVSLAVLLAGGLAYWYVHVRLGWPW